MNISARAMNGLLLADLPMCQGEHETVKRSRIQSFVDNSFGGEDGNITKAEYRVAIIKINKLQVDLVEAKKVVMKCLERESK